MSYFSDRRRKAPGETTITPPAGPGDTGEVSVSFRNRQNTDSPFYSKRVKNNKDGEGAVTYVSTDIINKITVMFDSGVEKKFLDQTGFPDPLQVIAKTPAKHRKHTHMEMTAAAAAGPVLV